MYMSKTTVISIECVRWEDDSTEPSIAALIDATRAAAILIGQMCQMDIMSLSYEPKEEDRDRRAATVVYVNNGVSLADIRRIMAPAISNNPPSYWMILDISEWQGSLDCEITARGSDETWE